MSNGDFLLIYYYLYKDESKYYINTIYVFIFDIGTRCRLICFDNTLKFKLFLFAFILGAKL